MVKALDNSHHADAPDGIEPVRYGRDWRKSMSDNVAWALLAYTALQIFVTVHALQDGLPSIFPYILLVLLVAGIIPACRWFERRWVGMNDVEAANPDLAGAFRKDQIMLWLLAIGLPFLLTGIFKVLFSVV